MLLFLKDEKGMVRMNLGVGRLGFGGFLKREGVFVEGNNGSGGEGEGDSFGNNVAVAIVIVLVFQV